jgi:hypothetical protein
MRSTSRNTFLGLLISTSLVAAPAFARSAGSLQNLIGERGNTGQSQLERQGFVYITGHEGRNAVHSYYWHHSDKNCVEVKTSDGRFSQIRDAANSDCNHSNEGSGAGVAIAGAVVGAALIAALAHKSGHHEDGQHYADVNQDAQYERGFNDGLHNTAYHNYDRSDYYSNGYQAGVEQRTRNTSYHSGQGGYAHHVSLSGIKGRDPIWAIDEMTARGFAGVDAFSSGNTTYGIYYNRATGQCVQMTNSRNKVEDVRDIGNHPNCR